MEARLCLLQYDTEGSLPQQHLRAVLLLFVGGERRRRLVSVLLLASDFASSAGRR